MRTRMTVIGLAALACLALALPGAAAELDPADRALIHGYDPGAMQLVWAALLDTTAEDACALGEASDDGEYLYEVDENGEVTVDGSEGDCAFNVTDVTGPEGQVNHGTVVSNFVKALKGSGYEGGVGCFVRIIAQSDYGKGDQQVTVSEVDGTESEESAEEGDTSVELTVSETTCGKPDNAGPPEDKGKPDNAGPPAGKGKPDNAGPPEGKGKPPWAGNGNGNGNGKP